MILSIYNILTNDIISYNVAPKHLTYILGLPKIYPRHDKQTYYILGEFRKKPLVKKYYQVAHLPEYKPVFLQNF